MLLPHSGVESTCPPQPGETVIPNQYLVKVAAGVDPLQVMPKLLPGEGYYPLTANLSLMVTARSSMAVALASIPGSVC